MNVNRRCTGNRYTCIPHIMCLHLIRLWIDRADKLFSDRDQGSLPESSLNVFLYSSLALA
jgi:hypothetical protein